MLVGRLVVVLSFIESPVSVSSNRFCAIKFQDSTGLSFIFICVYMPGEYLSSSPASQPIVLRQARFFYIYIYKSVKIIQLDVGMHHAKNCGNKESPLAILSRILAQSCVTLCLNYVGRVTHDCASILDSIAKGNSLFP